MTAKLEDQVNEAIEFFPGRVKRDQWVAQAKILLGEDAKLDEKALKEAEELERIAQKAEQSTLPPSVLQHLTKRMTCRQSRELDPL